MQMLIVVPKRHRVMSHLSISRASDFFQDWWTEVTHGAKNGGSFSESLMPKHIKPNTLSFE